MGGTNETGDNMEKHYQVWVGRNCVAVLSTADRARVDNIVRSLSAGGEGVRVVCDGVDVEVC